MTLFDHHVHTERSDGRLSLEARARSVAVRPHGVFDHFPWREKMRDDDEVRCNTSMRPRLSVHRREDCCVGSHWE